MLDVVYEVPVPSDVPPVAAAYQFKVPALAVAPKVAVPVPHIAAGVVAVTVGIAFTVMTELLLVAIVVDTQLALEVKTTLIVSFVNNDEVVNTVEFVPTLTPFFNHWYAGVVPPLVAVAVKVTLVPAQMVVPGLATTATLGVTVKLVSFIPLLFEVTFTKQGVAFDVITTYTESPFTAPLNT